MDREEVTKWLKIMKANLNTFPEVSSEKKIEALAEAIRLLKNEQSEKPDCGNEKCKKLGTLSKGYDCALWQPKVENYSIKTVTNAKEAENYPISEDISKLKRLTKLIFENEQAEQKVRDKMTRLEENKMLIKEMETRAKLHPEGTYEEMTVFSLGAIVSMLADISKSLAILADKAEREDKK